MEFCVRSSTGLATPLHCCKDQLSIISQVLDHETTRIDKAVHEIAD